MSNTLLFSLIFNIQHGSISPWTNNFNGEQLYTTTDTTYTTTADGILPKVFLRNIIEWQIAIIFNTFYIKYDEPMFDNKTISENLRV